MLLLVAVALAFVAFGFGQLLGGGGLLAVFVAGVLLSNGRYRIGRFEQQALGRVMHPLNTAAEITVLLLLGLLVQPAALLTVLPLGLALGIVVPLARLLAVWAVMPAPTFPWRDRLVVAGCRLRAAGGGAPGAGGVDDGGTAAPARRRPGAGGTPGVSAAGIAVRGGAGGSVAAAPADAPSAAVQLRGVSALKGELATRAAMPSCSRHSARGRSQPCSQRWASSGALTRPSSRP